MENRPYSFFYVRRHKTQKLINMYVHQLDKHQFQRYMNKINEYLYQFKIKDLYSTWTVLKTYDEVQYFMGSLNGTKSFQKLNFLTTKFGFQQHHQKNKYQDTQFQLKQFYISQNDVIPQNIIKFFQIYNHNIIKLSSLRMQKKRRGLTRTKKIVNKIFGVKWQMKRIIITKEGVLQMDDDGTITDFLKYDLYFNVQSGEDATGQQLGIALYSAQRKVVLRAINQKDVVDFLCYVKVALQNYKTTIYYMASSPISTKNVINYYVDAKYYYEDVADAIQAAQKTIHICGWWISPQLYLKRPISENKRFRLDRLLKDAATRGVKVFIVVFLSPGLIPNNSQYTKKKLTELHQNITVERHPHEILPKLWSHHQKCVVIDQKVAFMGGLDLCYGRFDDQIHQIDNNSPEKYPGIHYNNVRIRDFANVEDYKQQLQDRYLPRLPWHDIAFRMKGRVVADVANHFIQYCNFAILQKKIAPIVSKATKQVQEKQNLQSINLLNGLLKFAVASSKDLSGKQKMQLQQHLQYKQSKSKTQKILRSQWLKNKFQINNGAGQGGLVLSIQSLGLLKVDKYAIKQEQKYFVDQLQLLRSSSEWSIGLENGVIERSIQNAYLSMIKNARHFIYIQNQFFISATGEKNSFVANQIANALFDRIAKAHQKGQKFRVVVFMPLVPGMQGNLNQRCPLALRLTMFWQYNTISQNPQSLLARVNAITNNQASRYIQFYGLRNHGILQGQPVTQIIYIHSKLIIVDDHVVLCGSANINDRSQEGQRDSELAIIFSDGNKTIKKMGGQLYQINEKAHDLRARLYAQHFGLSMQQVEDPLDQKTLSRLQQITETNTSAYRQIFGCTPDDNVKKFSEVDKFQKLPNIEVYKNLGKNIRGHAVYFPTKFLSQEKLYKMDLSKVQDIFT